MFIFATYMMKLRPTKKMFVMGHVENKESNPSSRKKSSGNLKNVI